MSTDSQDTVQNDALALGGIDHLELYVGNARQAKHFYEWGYGFELVAYAGPETGVRDRASYVMKQGDARLVLTSPIRPDSPIAEHIAKHGDGVKDISLLVRDAEAAYELAVSRGATGVREPWTEEDADGVLQQATIATYGDTVHTFVSREGYSGLYGPGFHAPEAQVKSPLPSPDLLAVDHVVGNVELGKMDEWVEFYERVLGFSQLAHFTDKAISTEYSALMSKVVWDGVGRVKFPINEPAVGKRKSQIDEYLEFYGGPGVQHIAIATDDILHSVASMEARGVKFMNSPDTYYVELRERFADLDIDIDKLREHMVLADRDEEGYLLQIFSRMVQDRPTVFFELIERHGSRGFGEGNFKALFVAIELEQELRGNL
ncbi:MAG TPA: 4-hydroxyphenylpyruvate dioxygenase [Acidimicrobiales bacterium]|nr:4-hydroxyphenylpyruvate dioxygenase [Acidimicrobiales bacterium]